MNHHASVVASATVSYVQEKYQLSIDTETLILQPTRKDFEGDITLVVFPLAKILKKSPTDAANEIGEALIDKISEISRFNVVQGFLNISMSDSYWIDQLKYISQDDFFGQTKPSDNESPILVEYSSPNTNKPLHLGHIRNNLLGNSISRILAANGKRVVKVNLVNDRGVHICKSMLAWQKWGDGETPESSNLKGDHLVGKYYVEFDKHYKEEIAQLKATGISDEEAEKQSLLMAEVREMLKKWEDNDIETRQLWHKMNNWVYDGFHDTYSRMGITFDKIYYESDTYLKGKDLVKLGLNQGILFQKPDGSVWIDLTNEGLDEKLLLRSDGTSVYMTQDLGTAQLRYNEFHPQKMIYVVGNEQNYHFDVLKLILSKIKMPWAETIQHLSYGMVELPAGKMKSREGTVVDADDLMEQMHQTAKQMTEELGKTGDMTAGEAFELHRKVSLAALKYFILKVDPKKNMLFNPAESIDFNGNTGPFIQYTYARICSIMRKSGIQLADIEINTIQLTLKERMIVRLLAQFASTIQEAGQTFSPAIVANYCYDLAKEFNQFYHDHSILQEPDQSIRDFRIILANQVSKVLHTGMSLLGIELPEKM